MQDQQTLAQARRWAKQQRFNGQPVSVAAFNNFRNNKARANVITVDPRYRPHIQTFESHTYPLCQIDSIIQHGTPSGYFYYQDPSKTLSMPLKSAYGQQTFWHPRSISASPSLMVFQQQEHFYDPDLIERDPETGEVIQDKNPYIFKAPDQFTARMQAMQDFYRAQTGKTALNPQQAMDYATNYVNNKGWLKQQGTLEQKLNSKGVAKHLQGLAVQPLRNKMDYTPKSFQYGARSATDQRNYYLRKNSLPIRTRFINDNWFNY